MSTINAKPFSDPKNINLKYGLLRFGQKQGATNPFDASSYGLYINSSGQLVYSSLGSPTIVGAAGGAGSTLDSAYDAGRVISVNAGAVTLNGENQDTAVLAITGDGDSAGALLTFSHTTATRNDILGTGSTWKVTGQGAAEFQASVTTVAIVGYDAGADGNLTIDAKGTGTITIGGTSTGAVTITPALTATASVTITGSGGSTVFTITAGDAVLSDGSVAITDADNANSLSVVNNTATTIGAATNTGLVEFASTSLTTGTLLHLELTEGTLNGGHYLKAWDITAGAAVFSIGEDGATTIAGVGGSNVLTITAGDVLMSDGSITVTDADNAASLSITNDTATTASVFVFAGSGTFTGSTTTSFMTITPSGLTTGTAVYLPVAALTTGKALHVVGNAVTTGILVNITSSAATTQLTGAGRLFKVDHSGNATGSGVVAEFASAAADETVILKVTASAALAAGVALDISAAALTTGKVIDMSDLDAITTGKAIHVDATGVTQTDGILVHVDTASTALTATGRALLVDHTGNATASGAGIIAEFKSAATDATTILKVTASAALAAGAALKVSGASITTGTLLDVSDANALTTGKIANFVGNSSDTGTRSLVYIKQDHASASGATALEVVQDGALAAIKVTSAATSTNYFKIATMNGVTLWMGNGTTANGNLSGTAGDILFNGGSNKPEYCTGTTNWTALV